MDNLPAYSAAFNENEKNVVINARLIISIFYLSKFKERHIFLQ